MGKNTLLHCTTMCYTTECSVKTAQSVEKGSNMSKELWDAYYPDGTLAGVDLTRGEKIPDEYRHAVAEVFVAHEDGTVLLMQRDFNIIHAQHPQQMSLP